MNPRVYHRLQEKLCNVHVNIYVAGLTIFVRIQFSVQLALLCITLGTFQYTASNNAESCNFTSQNDLDELNLDEIPMELLPNGLTTVSVSTNYGLAALIFM